MNQGHRSRAVTILLASFAMPITAGAQDIQPGQSIRDLPRPGYETGRWRVGNVILLPTLSASTTYDSNVFATSVNSISDAVFDIRPRIEAQGLGSDLKFNADAYVNARLLAEQTTEDMVAFGAGGSGSYILNQQTSLLAGLRFDRDYQRRSDPEADPVLREPALFNTFAANAGFRWQGNNILLGLNGSVQAVNFLDVSEDDRDLTTWRGALRVGYAVSPRIGFYLEPYANYRNTRLPVDRNGVDRDMKTFGALAGVTFDITDRLRGEVGAGAFKANPAGTLESFTGLAFAGKLSWSPAVRTQISFNAFQGDVATIQSGASGRIDSRMRVRIDQEIRHNLLFNAGAGYQRTSYRGNTDRRLRIIAADAELEYLVSRTISIFVAASHESRTATSPLDQFDRTTAGIGIRLRT
ncbi:hypothetical protein GCM10011529_21040 [Polymorphobacter glacialis]|uniref:Outer membrane beta-barrel protein n=1 Tax=Sandarakinorhabdus glacialis TaxID=1614636 RepID=A0A916ZV99_9SPHN|nr:outer membrane beta-barrel protein [Polymorphobacter glacialis]GGE14460.1 hypothetical protein GCM10011529_21040 [Polymorphobacter glacialis]